MLIILSGLPGVGKTTIARELARRLEAVHIRIDSIEHALSDLGRPMNDRGYRVAYAVALDNLRLGRRVIADSVNPLPATRASWRAVAQRAETVAREIEIRCSDPVEHRRRVEGRTPDIAGMRLPTWAEVVARDYRPWDRDRIVIDTARFVLEDCVEMIMTAIGFEGSTALLE